jgi:hypothetical protein
MKLQFRRVLGAILISLGVLALSPFLLGLALLVAAPDLISSRTSLIAVAPGFAYTLAWWIGVSATVVVIGAVLRRKASGERAESR